MQVLSSHQCFDVQGAGRSVSGVISDAALGATQTAASVFVALKASEYTFGRYLLGKDCYSTGQITQYSVLAGAIYFAGYIGGSIYAHCTYGK